MDHICHPATGIAHTGDPGGDAGTVEGLDGLGQRRPPRGVDRRGAAQIELDVTLEAREDGRDLRQVTAAGDVESALDHDGPAPGIDRSCFHDINEIGRLEPRLKDAAESTSLKWDGTAITTQRFKPLAANADISLMADSSSCAAPLHQNDLSSPGPIDDILLLAALAANVALVVFARPGPDGSWAVRWYGQAKDPQLQTELFDRIASTSGPVETPGLLNAVSGTHVTIPDWARWVLGVAVGDGEELLGVLMFLDPWLRSSTHREDVTLQKAARRIVGVMASVPVEQPAPHVEPQIDLWADPKALRRDRMVRTGTAGRRRGHVEGPYPHFLRTSDVAARFDVTERTVINWVAQGKVPSVRTAGGHLRYRPEDIDALISKRR